MLLIGFLVNCLLTLFDVWFLRQRSGTHSVDQAGVHDHRFLFHQRKSFVYIYLLDVCVSMPQTVSVREQLS